MERTSGLLDWARWWKDWITLPLQFKEDGWDASGLLGHWSDGSVGSDLKRVALRDRKLRSDDGVLEVVDYGAGTPPGGAFRETRIATVARSAASDARKGRWLMAAAAAKSEEVGGPRMLELGTCLGSGADYLLTGGGSGAGYLGLEGSEALAALTRVRLGHHVEAGADVQVREGPFSETLPMVIGEGHVFDVVFMDGCHEGTALLDQWSRIQPALSPGAIVVVDDIRWSKDMHGAWLQLCASPAWSGLDLFRIGVLWQHLDGDPTQGGPRRCRWRQRA